MALYYFIILRLLGGYLAMQNYFAIGLFWGHLGQWEYQLITSGIWLFYPFSSYPRTGRIVDLILASCFLSSHCFYIQEKEKSFYLKCRHRNTSYFFNCHTVETPRTQKTRALKDILQYINSLLIGLSFPSFHPGKSFNSSNFVPNSLPLFIIKTHN